MVRDEIRLTKNATAYWFAHTRAEITVTEDGKGATLTQNGKRLFARIMCGEDAVFTIMPAVPFPTSPVIEGQKKNEGVRKLTVMMKDTEGTDLEIAFSINENFESDGCPLSGWASL